MSQVTGIQSRLGGIEPHLFGKRSPISGESQLYLEASLPKLRHLPLLLPITNKEMDYRRKLMRRAAGAIGAVIAAAVVIDRLKALNTTDSIPPGPTMKPNAGPPNPREAYCLSCRMRRQVMAPENILMSNGKAGIKGFCPVCRKGLVSMAAKAA